MWTQEEESPATTPKQNAPFRRVREEEVYVDPRLQDNSFDAKVSANYNQSELCFGTKSK